MDTAMISTSIGVDPGLQRALSSAWQALLGFSIAPPGQSDLFVYFKTLDEVLVMLSDHGGAETVDGVMVHVDYLADKAGCRAGMILGGGYFIIDTNIIIDALVNISAILRAASWDRPERLPAGIPEAVFALILEAEAKLEGWCSREKALMIAQTVLQERPRVCVEIGIFGGRSLVPCAAALQHLGSGAIYGIEAWSPNVAIENATDQINDQWWSKVDFPAIKREFYRFIAAADLTQQVRLVEAPSGRAAALFDQIDFLHIDGSHSMLNAAEDVILYARKVRSGGIVVFDDVNWQSTAPARELLATLCDTVAALKDPTTDLEVCVVLRRR